MKRILIVLFAIVLFASCNRVSGTYVNESGGLYERNEFVGKTSCTITALGMKFPATYRIDIYDNMKVAGHADYKSMKPYIDITEKAKTDAMDAMEKALNG